MRLFRLRSGSGLRTATRKEVDSHIICKQDPYRSSNKLHNNGEEVFGGGLRTTEVSTIDLGEQDHYLH